MGPFRKSCERLKRGPFSRSISALILIASHRIVIIVCCEPKKANKSNIVFVFVFFSLPKTLRQTLWHFSSLLFIGVVAFSCILYYHSHISEREQSIYVVQGKQNQRKKKKKQKKNRLSMLSIEFLWAMKGKISVFTTFMIAKYFYVRARILFTLSLSLSVLYIYRSNTQNTQWLSFSLIRFNHFSRQPPLFLSLFLMASARFIVSICFEWVFSFLLRSIPQLKCWKWAKVRFILWIFDTLLLIHSAFDVNRCEWHFSLEKCFVCDFYHNKCSIQAATS